MSYSTKESRINNALDDILKRGLSGRAAAKKYNIPEATLRGVLKKQNVGNKNGANWVWTEEDDRAELKTVVSHPIRTLDDLIAVCNIDTEVWNIDKWECSAWTVTVKETAGDKDQARQHQNYRVWARLSKRVLETKIVELSEDLLERLKRVRPADRGYRKPAGTHCVVMNIPDLHMNKLAYDKNLKEVYNLQKAKDLEWAAVTTLAERFSRYQPECIYFPRGNDLLHVDNDRYTTTKGTFQEADKHWKVMFNEAVALIRDELEALAKIAPVIVPIIEDNHAKHLTFAMGQVLSAMFHNSERIKIVNMHAPRVYFRYGANLFGFAHGHCQKEANLPQLMASEAREDWSKSKWCEFYTGHLHHHKRTVYKPSADVEGVRIRLCPSLSPADDWGQLLGHVTSMRGGECSVYEKDTGLVADYYMNESF